ncbi:MAG: hypothetical protein ACFFDF_04615 [Candidatus Odinarchaeota archaeon]
MPITIQEIIKSVFSAIEQQGIFLSQVEYTNIERKARKIIDILMEKYEKEREIYAKFCVNIPCDIDNATTRNRTVKKFLKSLNPAVEMEFELTRKALRLLDSYDIFQGELDTIPCHMNVYKKGTQYSYKYVKE